jgi:cytochrome P450
MALHQSLAEAIVDGHAYADGAMIDEVFRRIRAEAPLDVAEPDGYDPFWVVSRHADIKDVERQPDLFHNGDRATVVQTKTNAAKIREATGGEPNMSRSVVTVDGKEHKDLRGVLFPHLTPRSVRPMEDKVRTIASEFADKMLELGDECDFAKQVAFLYPLRVLMAFMGVPREDEPMMLKLTQEIFSGNDPELNRSGKQLTPEEVLQATLASMAEMENYFLDVTTRLRKEPDDGLNSLIANARIDDDYLTRRQLLSYYVTVATAGHDTTSNATAGMMWALAERPHLFEQIRQDRSLIPALVDEGVRWVTPVKHFMRAATADCELAGQKIGKGDWMMLCYSSANRDELVFDDPFEFRLDRKDNAQLGFGYGIHVCLGQHLARLEMRVLWEELFDRLASVELSGPPARTISNFVCGPKRVPIRFKAC